MIVLGYLWQEERILVQLRWLDEMMKTMNANTKAVDPESNVRPRGIQARTGEMRT
jgi:hypothetical protein